jgi:uncharacterized membrane protein YedE/YeeE
MTFPIFPAHQLGLVFAVLSGFGFGFVLERAGFGRAQKLVAQFYGYDMSVFKVMFTAVVTAMLVVVVASGVGLTDFKLLADHATSETFLVPFAVGGALVGAGFVMSGYCPGTSFVATASGKLDGLATVLGVVVGSIVYAEVEPKLGGFQNSGKLGAFTLSKWLHLPPAVIAVLVVALALGAFVAAEKIERIVSGQAATPAAARRWVFAGLAVLSVVAIVTLAIPSITSATP